MTKKKKLVLGVDHYKTRLNQTSQEVNVNFQMLGANQQDHFKEAKVYS